MMRDDFDQVDIDVPIPYTITPKGRRDLQLALAEEAISRCAHQWKVDLHQGFVCTRCGAVAAPRKVQSIPAHLGLRERK